MPTQDMTTKTITITEDAYEALKRLQEEHESFSATIRRVAKRRSLSEFYGVLSRESGERLEKAIQERRKETKIKHEERMKKIVQALGKKE